MEKHYYYWAQENPFDDDSEMTIHCPRSATILEHEEACSELNELLDALDDAINSHKGIVPESAAKFISANAGDQGHLPGKQNSQSTQDSSG